MRFRASLPLLAVALLSCSDDSAPETDLLFETAIANAAGGVGTYAATGTTNTAISATNFPIAASGAEFCEYQATTAFFVCPTVGRGNVTMARSYQLLDSENKPLSTVNPLAVVSVRGVTAWSGTSGIATVFTLTRHEDATVSNIRVGPRTLNGTSLTHLSFTRPDGAAVVQDDTSTANGLVIPGGNFGDYPSGVVEVRRTFSVTPQSGPQTIDHTREVLTFNGTAILTVETTAGGSTTTCTIHLVSRAKSC